LNSPLSEVRTLRFLGAADTVTGSKFLLTQSDHSLLIDCGLFQGTKEVRLRNWERPPVEAATLKGVVLTHAHLDHSGYLPALFRGGYRGQVFATEGTHSLCRILLPDSGHLQEEEADYANRKGYSKHTPALPLYTEEEAWKSLEHFSSIASGKPFDIGPFRVTLRHAGHILGASSALVQLGGRRRILFSGDLGRPFHPLLRTPEPPPDAEVMVLESTYGDRIHDDQGALSVFAEAIARTAGRGGVVIIPSFAVDRTEVVLFYLRRLQLEGQIPRLPVYVDSPMALAALRLYQNAIVSADPDMKPDVVGKPEILKPDELIEVKTVDDSISLNARSGPMVIISASGMATGGRVLHHLANRLPDKRNTVILVGYQAEGTRGRSLLDGAPSVKMLGRYVPVAADIVNIPAFSVHADQSEIIRWLKTAASTPEVVYLVHGDHTAAKTLRQKITMELGWNVVVPHHLERVRLD